MKNLSIGEEILLLGAGQQECGLLLRLRWEQAARNRAGLAGRLLAGLLPPRAPLDLELVLLLCDRNGEMLQTVDTQLRQYGTAAGCLHDAQTAGDAQGELYALYLGRLPDRVATVRCAAYLYDAEARRQRWAMLEGLSFQAENAASKTVLFGLAPSLADNRAQGMLLGDFTRDGTRLWRFHARMQPLWNAAGKASVLRQLSCCAPSGLPEKRPEKERLSF